MSGSISLSLSQQFDSLGRPLSGGKLYFYEAGTTATPQNAYQDSGLTILHANPITLDSAGRVPQFYLADGEIKIRLTDANGVSQVTADNILVVGASSGGGGGSSVDATTVIQPGQMVHWYGTGAQSGFVRCNGRTIGSATSGATERANSDTSALFVFLYGADANLAVSGGRGASAAADFAANKTIALPDLRGRALVGLDSMGASAANRLTAAIFGASDTLGTANAAGGESSTLATANLPAYTPSGTVALTVSGGGAATKVFRSSGSVITHGGGAGGTADGVQPGTGSLETITAAFTGTAQGGSSTAFSNLQPCMAVTIYMKL